MRIITEEVFIPRKELSLDGLKALKDYYLRKISLKFPTGRPVRFVVTKSEKRGYNCEIDFIVFEKFDKKHKSKGKNAFFDFRRREFEDAEKFTAVLIIPTGIGAELGGHCGDGNAVARLIASACDTLITHPNVVNASDINEMTENTLYVEGSILTRLLMGQIGLERVRSNKILMLMDKHPDKFFNEEIINAVSSARITLGIDCDVLALKDTIESKSTYSKSGRATGEILHLESLFNIIEKYKYKYGAFGLSTFISVPSDYYKKYFLKNEEMVNPWGGVEAMLTHSLAEILDMPCAHSPMMISREIDNLELGIVDPRKAPETASITYLHCILKGLHKAPRVTSPDKGINAENISCMIIPDKCIGLPTLACIEQGIPVIAVRENKNKMKNNLKDLPFERGKLFIVDNYLEAVGVMHALKTGVSVESVRRPIRHTTVLNS
ncbi:MAG: DUF3326 domain-containing protein [Candidatus Moraniibacteriota bacterium]